MKMLFSAVIDAKEVGTGRRLCELFMVKPFKKDYPDYYKVILEPMDLKTIEHNIRAERYANEDALLVDMKLMFRNARHYNEEGSQVGTADMLLLLSVGVGVCFCWCHPPRHSDIFSYACVIPFIGLQRLRRPGEGFERKAQGNGSSSRRGGGGLAEAQAEYVRRFLFNAEVNVLSFCGAGTFMRQGMLASTLKQQR